jgi:hypothetical protein
MAHITQSREKDRQLKFLLDRGNKQDSMDVAAAIQNVPQSHYARRHTLCSVCRGEGHSIAHCPEYLFLGGNYVPPSSLCPGDYLVDRTPNVDTQDPPVELYAPASTCGTSSVPTFEQSILRDTGWLADGCKQPGRIPHID